MELHGCKLGTPQFLPRENRNVILQALTRAFFIECRLDGGLYPWDAKEIPNRDKAKEIYMASGGKVSFSDISLQRNNK